MERNGRDSRRRAHCDCCARSLRPFLCFRCFPQMNYGGRGGRDRDRGGGGGEGSAHRLAKIFGTEEDTINCPFYYKIGACRHGDRCSRNHVKPHFSCTLLIPKMYTPPTPDPQTGVLPDTFEHFEDFYEEVLDELKQFGAVEDMVVVENLGEHMNGNTYIKVSRGASGACACMRVSTWCCVPCSIRFSCLMRSCAQLAPSNSYHPRLYALTVWFGGGCRAGAQRVAEPFLRGGAAATRVLARY